jgi:DNA repair exonuclease SbcCD ATPase subunit
LEKEIELKKPPENVLFKIRNMMDEVNRLKGIDQPRANKLYTDEEVVNLLEEKLKKLKELDKKEFNIEKGSKEEYEFNKVKKEIKHQIDYTEKRLEQLKEKKFVKVASTDDPKKELSPYELALETKGVSPAPFMKELKKPKGWEFLENFLEDLKRDYKRIINLKDKSSEILDERLLKIEKLMKALEAYKNMPIINIGGEKVSFRDIVNKFEDLIIEYTGILKKLTNQREDAIKKLNSLKQQYDYLKTLFDPETGEFKGFSKEEIENFKGIFLRMLYRDLDRYWATKVGKNLVVFGERDTDWYNNVYNTFKNLADIKSNRKTISLLNKYKQEIKADLDDVASRLKIDELKKRLKNIIETYKEISKSKLEKLKKEKNDLYEELKKEGRDPEVNPRIKKLNEDIIYLSKYGVDPTKNETVRDLINRIELLEKQKENIDRLFKIMGAASAAALHKEFEQTLKEKIKKFTKGEEIPEIEAKLEDKAEQYMEKATEELEKNKDDIIKIDDILNSVETSIEKGEMKLGLKKVAVYNKNHPDFNMRILYGSLIQKTIEDMLEKELIKCN